MYQQAHDIFPSAWGEEHPDVATIMNNLAWVYEGLERYDDAERLHRRAFEISKKVFGEAHPKVATSLNNLASVFQARRDFAAAEQHYLQAVAIFRQTLPPNHPSIASQWRMRKQDGCQDKFRVLQADIADGEDASGVCPCGAGFTRLPVRIATWAVKAPSAEFSTHRLPRPTKAADGLRPPA